MPCFFTSLVRRVLGAPLFLHLVHLIFAVIDLRLGMNYFRNMLSFYTGVNTQEGAKALYGSMSFVFRTTHLSHDVQVSVVFLL